MNSLTKAILLIAVILTIGAGLVFWKVTTGGFHAESEGLTKLSKEDMELIIKDFPPQALKRLAEDPELKKKQVESIKGFLAIAEEARRTGFADKPEIKEELEEIENSMIAINYDQEKNKDKKDLPEFSSISKEQVDGFFQNPENSKKFDAWVQKKLQAAQKAGSLPENFQPSPEQLESAKDEYAKVNIALEEAKANWANLPEEFKRETEIKIKIQQAQFLNARYGQEVLSKKLDVTDADTQAYLAAHPEDAKAYNDMKAKAEEILNRAKSGEDFAKLAAEFSEDPGSKKDGGLYKEVKKGQMVSEFETSALSVEAGQVVPTLVESKFGYHIIKLERKGVTKDAEGKEEETYDARHILLSGSSADAQNPLAQPMPLKEKIRAKVQKDKAENAIKEMVARNKIEVAEDFQIKVPEIPAGQDEPPMGMPGGGQMTPEQMEQIKKQIEEMQKQQGQPKPKADKK